MIKSHISYRLWILFPIGYSGEDLLSCSTLTLDSDSLWAFFSFLFFGSTILAKDSTTFDTVCFTRLVPEATALVSVLATFLARLWRLAFFLIGPLADFKALFFLPFFAWRDLFALRGTFTETSESVLLASKNE